MEIIKLKRVFKHNDNELEDPDEKMSKDEVLDFYSTQYPELVNASVTGPEIVNDKLEYIFSTSTGTKG